LEKEMELRHRSAIFRAVEQVIRVSVEPHVADSGSRVIYSYADSVDFQRMWSTPEIQGKSDAAVSDISDPTGQVTFVVVWDGVPPYGPRTINVCDPLTPFDWTVALSWYAVAHRNVARFRILILDAAPSSFADSARGHFFEPLLRRCTDIPWMKVFPARDGGLAGLMHALNNTAEPMLDPSSPPTSAFCTIREVLRDQLLSAGDGDDHHLLANRLGPLMLTGETGDDPHLRALLNMTKWICWNDKPASDLATPKPFEPVVGTVSPRPWRELLDIATGEVSPALRLLMVDDFAFDGGWAHSLARALELKETDESPHEDGQPCLFARSEDGSIRLDATKDPHWLLDQIIGTQLLPDVSDRRFSLRLGEPQGVDHTTTILFLDLRLFQTEPMKERDFFRKLIGATRAYSNAVLTPPWPQFKDTELAEIEEWLDHPTSSAGAHARALSLLPRLISQIDPSLPIALFSSTAWRAVLGALVPYGNILTHFEKPGSDAWRRGATGLEHAVMKLDQVIQDGLAMSLARRKGFHFLKRLEAPPVPKVEAFTHVELYLDESRKDYLDWCVGGCVAIFEGDSREEACRKADDFDDVCSAEGIRFFLRPPPLPFANQRDIKRKRHDVVHKELAKAMRQNCAPRELGFLKLTDVSSRRSSRHSRFFRPTDFDNAVFYALDAAIEMFLFDFLPVTIGNENLDKTSVSIFTGTRRAYFSLEDDKDTYQFDYRFGFNRDLDKGQSAYYTINPDDVYRIIAALLRRHGVSRDIQCARAVPLPYAEAEFPKEGHVVCRDCLLVLRRHKNKDDTTFPTLEETECLCSEPRDATLRLRTVARSLHYVADQMLYDESAFSELLSWTWFDDLDESLERVLDASRALDRKDTIRAMCILPMSRREPDRRSHNAASFVAQRISAGLSSLRGRGILNFCNGNLAVALTQRQDTPLIG